MTDRFRRTAEGVQVSLPEPEANLLRSLPAELRPVFEAPPDPGDPVRARLWPRAYSDPLAEDAEREWQELVHPDLVRERLQALELVTATLDRGRGHRGRVEVLLTDEEAQAWLGVLNDARLALGTRLGVTEDLDYEDMDPDQPESGSYAVYGWLTWLQGDLVETMLSG